MLRIEFSQLLNRVVQKGGRGVMRAYWCGRRGKLHLIIILTLLCLFQSNRCLPPLIILTTTPLAPFLPLEFMIMQGQCIKILLPICYSTTQPWTFPVNIYVCLHVNLPLTLFILLGLLLPPPPRTVTNIRNKFSRSSKQLHIAETRHFTVGIEFWNKILTI